VCAAAAQSYTSTTAVDKTTQFPSPIHDKPSIFASDAPEFFDGIFACMGDRECLLVLVAAMLWDFDVGSKVGFEAAA